MITITVIIHTLNEERNIANVLRSVTPWADEILIIDMFSEDRTVEIAESFGAKIFQHERKGTADPARAFAESQASSDWVFVVDADEVVPASLVPELRRIADNDLADICSVPRLNYFSGEPMRYSGWGPEQDYLIRFYKRQVLRHSHDIHTQPSPVEGARVSAIQYKPGHAIVHFNYVDLAHFLEKLNRYTTIEAIQLKRTGRSASYFRMIYGPPIEFANRYIRRQGYRDGWRGLFYCILMLFYRLITLMKLHELSKAGSPEEILQKYQTVADSYLSEYPHP